MNVSKTPQGSWITISASGTLLGAAILGVPPNANTPLMSQPPKPPMPLDTSENANAIAKRNQVNFIKKTQFQKN